MKSFFAVLALASAANANSNPPALGSFATTTSTYSVPRLDSSDPQVWVHAPVAKHANQTFPVVAYNHGAGGGGIAILGYSALFEQIASYGVIVAATRSCAVGCRDASIGNGWGETYAAEQRKVIEWARELGELNGVGIDFSNGVAIAGHSMGGESTGINSRAEFAEALDIRAAIFHQAAILGEAEGRDVSVPSAHFTGTADGPEARKNIFDGAPSPKVYRNQAGETHTEPVLLAPNNNPALGPFMAHWINVYMGVPDLDKEHSYEMIYGSDPSSLCKYAPMDECIVVPN
jgi:hypothetical protein